MLKGILISLTLTALGMIIQIVLSHIRQPEKLFNFTLAIFGASIPVYAALYFFLASEKSSALGFLNGLLVHLLLYFNYVQCLYYFTRPVTLRILIEFLNSPGERLTKSDLQKNYSLGWMIRSRLDLIVLNGYVQKSNAAYTLTPKGARFAKLLLFLRNFFGVPYYLDRQWS